MHEVSRQGGCAADDIHPGHSLGAAQQVGPGAGADAGGHPGGHGHGVAQHQEGAAAQGGVHEVLTQAAEELLDHHDGEEVADDQHPIGQGGGAHEGQQHAGDGGGQVLDGAGLVHQLAVAPLEELAGQHGDDGGHQGTGAEEHHAHDHGRYQGDEHVPHQVGGVNGRGHVGGRRHRESQLLFLVHALAASFAAFSLAARARSSPLVTRKDWTRWRRAGQM